MSATISEDKLGNRISEKFSRSDADLTLRSIDGVLFKVFSGELAMYSEGFPVADSTIISPVGEVVQLSETSSALELLLQFMQRRRQPDISRIGFGLLAQLAEGVEKYEVFPALELCKYHMQAALPDHPIEVLGYAMRHGYPELAAKAAPLTLDIPLSEAIKVLGTMPATLVAWVRYREGWLTALNKSVYINPPTTQHPGGISRCPNWANFHSQVLYKVAAEPGSLLRFETIFDNAEYLLNECHHCQISIEMWKRRIRTEIEKIPLFCTKC